MAIQNVPLIAFNRGLVSKGGLARIDLKRTALAAEIQTNWMSRVLGGMMVRPGLGFLGDSRADAQAFHIPFVFNLSDKALVELTDQHMRVWINGSLVTRVAVATQTVNGTFPANINNWTDLDEQPSAVSSWVAPNDMQLLGDGFNASIREQQVVVAGADLNKEHAIRIVVARGPVVFQVGSASGLEDYITKTTLGTGTHSLALTPTGNFWIRVKSSLDYPVKISNITIEAAGAMDLPTPWVAADLELVRFDISGDIIFVACGSSTGAAAYQQRTIERRGTRSWSVVLYEPEDGPFLTENLTTTVVQVSDLFGSVVINANKPIFKATQVGMLFRVTSSARSVVKVIACGLNVFTDPLRVIGVGTDRDVTVDVQNVTASGGTTVVLERSADGIANWTNVATYVLDQIGLNFNDGLDNEIWFYRLRTTVYVGARSTTLDLIGKLEPITGVVRVLAFGSATSVTGVVIKHLGDNGDTALWSEGAWSPFRGYPSAGVLHGGRMWWAGKGKEWGSISDGYFSFDDTVEGDSGTIARSIGSGPVDNIQWMLSLQRLLMGGELAEFQMITSNLDEPITPTNFDIRPPSTQGSDPVQAVKADTMGFFVRQGGKRLYQLAFDANANDFSSSDASAIVPDLFEDPDDDSLDLTIVRVAVQRKPDTRIHCVRADGKVAVLIFDHVENVACWVLVETDGLIEDAAVLPGSGEDEVYYSVKRTINGATKRFLERWAREMECINATVSKLGDAFIVYHGAPITHVPVAHLEGKQVVVWADGADVGYDASDALIYTVTGGFIDLAVAASDIVVGLPYNADWKGTKMAYAAMLGTALAQMKKIGGLALIARHLHARGLKYGMDFDNLDSLPQMEDGVAVDPDFVWSDYDKVSFEFDGDFESDARICLRGMAPRSAQLLGIVPTVETNEKI